MRKVAFFNFVPIASALALSGCFRNQNVDAKYWPNGANLGTETCSELSKDKIVKRATYKTLAFMSENELLLKS